MNDIVSLFNAIFVNKKTINNKRTPSNLNLKSHCAQINSRHLQFSHMGFRLNNPSSF